MEEKCICCSFSLDFSSNLLKINVDIMIMIEPTWLCLELVEELKFEAEPPETTSFA